MSIKNKKFYITTAIPYVNAKPHLGHALEFLQADVIARYHRLCHDDVYYLTGSDDNSLKNVQAAEAMGKGTAEFVEENTKFFLDLLKKLNISNDDFIHTASKKHFQGALKLWLSCKPEDIYKKKYTGFYCVGCESFYLEKDLVGGQCPEHQKKPEIIEEENYFFKLSNYQDKLFKLIESDEYKIVPETRKNEVLSFIKMGLEDFSISRSVGRAHSWGVPVPNDPSQIMYVWFDALSNYITALDYYQEGELYKKYWPADAHVVGKGIIRFHAVYWPAMLMSAKLPLPKELFVHGYVNVGGEKMSKSLGNVVDPIELVKKYGTDAVRYYLLKYFHPFEDSDFSLTSFKEVYNADLANGLGNLVARTANMVEKNLNGKVEGRKSRNESRNKFIEGYKFNEALKEINNQVTQADQLIDKEKPWELVKSDKEKTKKVLSEVVSLIIVIAEQLKPFLPKTAEKIIKQFTAKKIKKGEALFPRI